MSTTQPTPAPSPGSGSGVEVPVLEARGISRYFGSVAALEDVTLHVNRGEVVGLVGDNGAGKSTLVKILCGALQPSNGQLLVDGEAHSFSSPRESRDRGIEVVYQDLALATELSIADNIFLGRELRRGGPLAPARILDRTQMAKDAQTRLDSLGIEIDDVHVRCGLLSGGQRQAVAVARAVMWGSKLLLLDEPTAALAVMEQRKIGALIESVASHDIGVVLVSHNLRQVMQLCDRIVVLLRGHLIADLKTSETTVEDVVRWITGAAMDPAD
jgi:ABC-type sugar transport system ATPase subunit